MKRFYCTICQRVKRTQKWPIIIDSVDAVIPSARVGQCNWHSGMSNRVPMRAHNTYQKPVKTVKVAQTRKRA